MVEAGVGDEARGVGVEGGGLPEKIPPLLSLTSLARATLRQTLRWLRRTKRTRGVTTFLAVPAVGGSQKAVQSACSTPR